MSHAISDEALDTIFRAARTQNKWSDEPVSDAMLMAVYDLLRWGPTAANATPARFVFLTSMEAKLRLKPLLSKGNQEKTMLAPAVAIIAFDLDFPETLPRLFPNAPKMKDNYADKPEMTRTDALRNGSLQGAYLIIAARALGLDCGPMGGFDREGVDKEFFAGTNIRSNFLCALGHGDPAGVFARNPRLSFDEACRII
jgi:3-hydroxypropanoate dehydrogenase